MKIIFINAFIQKEHTSWANQLLKKGKRRPISDIRRSIGDGQTLVYILETLGEWCRIWDRSYASLFLILAKMHLYRFYSYKENKRNISSLIHVSIKDLRNCMQIFRNLQCLCLRFDGSVGSKVKLFKVNIFAHISVSRKLLFDQWNML